jgi:hypothetical protein
MTDRARRAFVARFAPKPAEPSSPNFGEVHLSKFDDSAEPEAASYDPALSVLQDAAYTGRDKHAKSEAERVRLTYESMHIIEHQADEDEEEQTTLEPAKPRQRTKAPKPALLDRYLVELAGMAESELAGELKKHKATLKKHAGAPWLHGVRDRLGLVEREIDARDGPGVVAQAVPIRARSQALRAPIAQQALL